MRKLIALQLFISILFNYSFLQAQTLDWVKGMGSIGIDGAYDIEIDSLNNIYSVGLYSDVVDFDPSTSGTYNLSTGPYVNVFISKYTPSGNLLFAKEIKGTNLIAAKTIELDKNGNLYVTGWFRGTADFDPGPGTYNLTSTSSLEDIFILKLDNNGNFKWAKSYGDSSKDNGTSIQVDLDGNVYSVGFFSGNIDFDLGPGIFTLNSSTQSAYILKLDSIGNFIWAKNIETTISSNIECLSLDKNENLLISGNFQGTADFDLTPSSILEISNGMDDVFLAKYDNNGSLIWNKTFGGTGIDGSHFIEVDNDNNVYTTGGFNDNVEFQSGMSGAIYNSPEAGIFLTKHDQNGNFQWVKSFIGYGYNTRGIALVCDAYSNIYLTGRFDGETDFDPSFSGALNISNEGDRDIFISKFDATGNLIWNHTFGTLGLDEGSGINLDSDLNIIFSGKYYSNIDFLLGGISNVVPGFGSHDMFISKINQNIVNINEQSTNSITAFPNPFNDNVFINLNNEYKDVNIEIYDVSGKLIQSNTYANIQLIDQKLNVAKGIYFLKIKCDGFVENIQLMKN